MNQNAHDEAIDAAIAQVLLEGDARSQKFTDLGPVIQRQIRGRLMEFMSTDGQVTLDLTQQLKNQIDAR